MTDAAMKQALDAALDKLPDGCFAVLLAGPVPPFGEKPKSVEVATSAGADQTREIIVGLARSIEKGQTGERNPPPVDV